MDALTLPHMAHGTAICTADRRPVQEQPNTTSQIFGKLSKGQKLIVWALDQDWMIVQTEDRLTGWAEAQYLKVDGELVV